MANPRLEESRSNLSTNWAEQAELTSLNAVLERFARGQVSADEFKTKRLEQGVYSQRQPGLYMVRVKIPGGRLTAGQFEMLGRLADRFADGQAHVTTRQDIQFHYVKFQNIQAMLGGLAAGGLTTREACGNSVRNVTACPLAGSCAAEEFNVYPYAVETARALLRNPWTQRLPRKFKIAFSGCVRDCALTPVNDIGLLARSRGRQRGFRLVAGGGLGSWPRAAVPLAEFVPGGDLPVWIEAILEVFNAFGNRRDRNRARLKFVLAKRGVDWFRRLVGERVEQRGLRLNSEIQAPISAAGPVASREGSPCGIDAWPGSSRAFSTWLRSNIWQQHQPDLAAAWIRLPQGILQADQIRLLGGLARRYGDATLCTTPSQNVILPNVAKENLRTIYLAVEQADLALPGAEEISDPTSCPGAATCRLGITRSRSLAAELSRQFDTELDPLTRQIQVKISGCPNSCGHHHLAAIGLHGLVRKLDGHPAPFYQLLLGGSIRHSTAQFGERVAVVPARFVPAAVARLLAFYRAERLPEETFLAFVNRRAMADFKSLLGEFTQNILTDPELFQDWGEEAAYELKVGEGECAS